MECVCFIAYLILFSVGSMGSDRSVHAALSPEKYIVSTRAKLLALLALLALRGRVLPDCL